MSEFRDPLADWPKAKHRQQIAAAAIAGVAAGGLAGYLVWGVERPSSRCGQARSVFEEARAASAQAIPAALATVSREDTAGTATKRQAMEDWQRAYQRVVAVVQNNRECFTVEEQTNIDAPRVPATNSN